LTLPAPSNEAKQRVKKGTKRDPRSKLTEALPEPTPDEVIPDLDPILSRFVNTSPASEVVEYVMKLNLSATASSALLVRLFREGKLAFAMAFAARLAEERKRSDVVWASITLISVLIDAGRLTEAHNLLSNIPLPLSGAVADAASRSLRSRISNLIFKYLERREVHQAWELFQLAKQHGASVFSSTLNALGLSLLQVERPSDAYEIFLNLASSNISPATKFSTDLARGLRAIGNMKEADEVLKVLEKSEKDVAELRRVLERTASLQEQPSSDSLAPSDPELSRIIALASSGDYIASLRAFEALEKMRDVPSTCLHPMMSAAASAGDLAFVKAMIKKLESKGISPDRSTKSMEMKAMFKSGDARGAFKYLERMRAAHAELDRPDKATYSIAISCLVDLGLPADIVQEWMEEDGLLDENDVISMGLSISASHLPLGECLETDLTRFFPRATRCDWKR
jgi:tetratricopeptide (TPR) repeat protein